MEEKILQLHNEGKTFNKISKITSIPRTSLARIEKRLGIHLGRERSTSPLEDKDYFETQLELTVQEANEKFGKKKVCYWEEAYGKKFKRLTLEEKAKPEEHYFDCIDSQEKAYILGLIWTDGCVHEKSDGGAVTNISLNQRDRELLEDIHKEISFGSLRDKAVDNTTILSFYSSYMTRKLISTYNCMVNKSLVIGWPENLQEKYELAFIRGCFDGDGGVYKGKVEFVSGSRNFMNTIHSKLHQYGSRELKIVVDTYGNRKNPLYRLILTGKDVGVMKKVYEEHNSSIYMKRKQKAYDAFWKEKCQIDRRLNTWPCKIGLNRGSLKW